MIIFIIAVILLLGIYVVIAPKNAVVWYFALYTFGMVIILISVAFYIFRLNVYPYLNSYDYTLYLYFQQFKPSFSEGRILLVSGVSFLLFANICAVFLFSSRQKKYLIFFILCLPVVIYFVLNHPETNELFHIMRYNSKNPFAVGILSQLNRWIHGYNWLLIGTYHILPFAVMIRNYCTTRIIYTRYSLLIAMLCMVLLYTNILYLSISSMNQYFNLDFMGFPVAPKEMTLKGYFFILALFVITLTFSLLTFFKLFRYFNIFSQKNTLDTRVSKKNLCMFFHMQKNLFLTMSKYTDVSEEMLQNNPCDVLERMKIIHSISDDALNHLSRSIIMLKATIAIKKVYSIYDLIDNAILRVNYPSNVRLEKIYPEMELYCLADYVSITECFVNIFNNAIEAIEAGMIEKGHICVDVLAEPQLICVDITDNGCGIAKSEIRHMFEPLYSQKSRSKNYGLGMSYVRDVLTAHNGHVDVKSVEGKYTTIQIVLPRYKEKRSYKWKKSK